MEGYGRRDAQKNEKPNTMSSPFNKISDEK